MPPIKKITKDMILDTAFTLSKERGFQSITVRSLADELHCSTQPIYKEFKDMKDLCQAVTDRACEYLGEFIQSYSDEALPKELSNIIGYVYFALEEPQLFQLIFASPDKLMNQNILREIGRVHPDMIIYANGLIMMMAYAVADTKDSKVMVREKLIHAYNAFTQ
jgi:AcrR family transcriptional regulator